MGWVDFVGSFRVEAFVARGGASSCVGWPGGEVWIHGVCFFVSIVWIGVHLLCRL